MRANTLLYPDTDYAAFAAKDGCFIKMEDRIKYHHVADAPGLTLSEGHFSKFSFDRHFHLDFHIGLVVEGVQRQHFKGQSFLLSPGEIVIMPPDEIHDGLNYKDNAYIQKMFRLSPELLSDNVLEILGLKRDTYFNPRIVNDKRLWQRLLRLHNLLQQNSSLNQMAVEEAWFLSLEPLFARLQIATPQSLRGGLSLRQKQRIVDYCYENIGDPISLEELAELCDMSRYQFLRRFKQSVGVTPHNWLVRLRLERACILLRLKKQNIADVAASVGFYDQSHFNKAFRHAYGVTPSEFQVQT